LISPVVSFSECGFVLVEMHTEQEVIYVRYRIEVQQEFVSEIQRPTVATERPLRTDWSKLPFAVETHRHCPRFAIELRVTSAERWS